MHTEGNRQKSDIDGVISSLLSEKESVLNLFSVSQRCYDNNQLLKAEEYSEKAISMAIARDYTALLSMYAQKENFCRNIVSNIFKHSDENADEKVIFESTEKWVELSLERYARKQLEDCWFGNVDDDEKFLLTEGYIKMIFRSSQSIRGNRTELSSYEKAVYCLQIAFENYHNGNYKAYVSYLREALSNNPNFRSLCQFMLDYYEVHRTENEKRDFNAYAGIVKQNIGNLIKRNDIQSASRLLEAFESLDPHDPDIPRLKEQLHGCK